jgi:hypothetical protein
MIGQINLVDLALSGVLIGPDLGHLNSGHVTAEIALTRLQTMPLCMDEATSKHIILQPRSTVEPPHGKLTAGSRQAFCRYQGADQGVKNSD